MGPKRVRIKKISVNVSCGEALHLFFIGHWRGILTLFVPFLYFPVVGSFPGQPDNWVLYTLLVMGTFWVTECIPVTITALIPIVIFPLTNILSTNDVCQAYMNDTIMMFIGSLFLASSIEQSGLHQRLVYFAIRNIGYSHMKLLASMCIVTTFVSMWITNTAATVMMVPITHGLLKVFEENGVLKVYDFDDDGELIASDMTTCYFCAATFSATIGGIGTLVGTGTNLVFKGLFLTAYPTAPEYLNFPQFSMFTVPYMIVLELFLYLYLAIVYFGVFRPDSPEASRANISKEAKKAAQADINKKTKAVGRISFHEAMVALLFGSTMVLFFSRSPQMFTGWADKLNNYFDIKDDPKFILDSALCMFSSFVMMATPKNLIFFKHTPKYKQDMPKGPIKSVLDWPTLNRSMPYSFMFLLGGGFTLSNAARVTGLNDRIGEALKIFDELPLSMVLFIIICVVVFVTNFASNVAVANVFVPITMTMAAKLGFNPFLFCITSGLCASYCFMLPVGTPGNLVVQSAAKIPTAKMMKAGFGPTLSTIVISWIAFNYWSPVVWPDAMIMPMPWIKE